MKLVKSLLLGSAAGLLAVATSQAADLPYRKAAPVAYVKVCDAYGTGYFYIPGTDTCLRVGGYALFEYEYVTPTAYAYNSAGGGKNVLSRGRDSTGDWTRARFTLDSRTATGYGPLRAVASGDINLKHGVEGAGNSVDFDKAFIQWAGITAGNVESFFDFFDDAFGYRDTIGSDHNPNLLGYTATFGGGFSASISLESQRANQTGFYDATANGAVLPDGYRVPDVVAQINVTQGWGSAQISGAAHEQRATSLAGVTDDQYGYAGLAGVNIKLPSLAAGDSVWLEGSAGKGALNYAWSGFGGRYYTLATGFTAANSSGALTTGVNGFGDFDGVFVGNSQKLPTWYHFTAAFQHFFSPQVDGGVIGSYINVKYPSSVINTVIANGNPLITTNYNEFDVEGYLAYHPVAGLTFGVEVIYSRLHNNIPAGFTNRYTADIDGFTGTLHVERDF